MGWSGGSELAEGVWGLFKKYVPAKDKKKVASKLIDMFEDMDCDTMDEAADLSAAAGRTEGE